MKTLLLSMAMLITSVSPANGQSIKTTQTASNGVEITVHSDEFANRYEYTAPTIDFPDLGGFALVARISSGGKSSPAEIVGTVMYRGEWRFYSSAILKGGEEVESTFDSRKVGSCSGSRYGGGCSLREGFKIRPTAEQIAKYAEGGILPVQLRARSGTPIIVSIPVNYIVAVNEVAKK